MDFSSLDLLASTALRDNNQPQPDPAPATPPHPQQSHNSTENDDDDEETDGKTDTAPSRESDAVDLQEESAMGSVKCGKHKKGTSKPVLKSIFVRDGKCVAEKASLPTSMILPGKGGKSLEFMLPDPLKTKDKLELCRNNNAPLRSVETLACPEEKACKSQSGAAASVVCNGTNSTSHCRTDSTAHKTSLQSFSKDSSDRAADSDPQVTEAACDSQITTVTEALPNSQVATCTEALADSHVTRVTEALSNSQVATITEALSDSQVTTSTKTLCDSQVTAVAEAPCDDSQITTVAAASCDSQVTALREAVCDSQATAGTDTPCDSQTEEAECEAVCDSQATAGTDTPCDSQTEEAECDSWVKPVTCDVSNSGVCDPQVRSVTEDLCNSHVNNSDTKSQCDSQVASFTAHDSQCQKEQEASEDDQPLDLLADARAQASQTMEHRPVKSGEDGVEDHLHAISLPSGTGEMESSSSSTCKEKAAVESDGCNDCDENCAVFPPSSSLPPASLSPLSKPPSPLPTPSSLLPPSSPLPTPSSLLPPSSPLPTPSSLLPPSSPLPTPSSLLPPSSPLPSAFPLPSSSTATCTGRDTFSSKDALDQDIGSSGNKSFTPSTNNLNSIVSPSPPHFPVVSSELVFVDHCYACSSDKMALELSIENTDDSGDAFESADENISADDIERRPRSLSVDSEYLQYGVPPTPSQLEGLPHTDRPSLLSPTLSVDSISNDSSLSEHSNAAAGQFYSILVGCQNPARTACPQKLSLIDSPGLGTNSLACSAEDGRLSASLAEGATLAAGGPKCGKFKIGTFGSFSNSHLDLETEAKKNKLKIRIPPDSKSSASPALASPGSPFPLLQSPAMEWDRSDAGSEAPDDLDSSTTDDKFLSSSHDSDAFGTTSSQVWHHPVFHDHDYCCKEVSEKLGKPVALPPPTRGGKRKYTKKKDRQECEEEQLKKGKYLKRELLKQDNRFSLIGGGPEARALAARSSLLAESLSSKPNPVGRPRKRYEKQMEEYDAETGAKMKITGKYQDQYVYYYSKTSRNRRRKLDDKMSSGDKIILPTPKPGDIVVPHLTDADCEAIKRGGRSAFRNGGTYLNPAQVAVAQSVPVPQGDNGDMMDSSIVNTILSMECDNLASPMGSHDGDGDGDLEGITGNLTTEQVDLLLDCLKDVEVPTTSQADLDFLTSAETVSIASSALDSLAATTVEEEFLVPDLPLDVKPDKSNPLHSLPLDVKPNPVPSLPLDPKPTAKSSLALDLKPCALSPDIKPSSSSPPPTIKPSPLGLDLKHIPHALDLKFGASTSSVPSAPSCGTGQVKLEASGESGVNGEPGAGGLCEMKQEVEEEEKPVVGSSLPGSPTSHPSVQKNLEFLKDPFIKSEFYPPASSVPSSSSSTDFGSGASSIMVAHSPAISELNHETPWIVTVTLYWNDIPAIIINNMPYVRLVDIHRQILPAKDTGILKKRCQLMHIQVNNCSEMQRYFLVQYGRAHNSKSTLVITKDEAWRLISYYAHPQPRNMRGEERAGLRRSSSYAELRSFMESPSNPRHSSPSPAFAHPRKRGGFRRRATPTRSHNPSPEPVVAAVTPQMMDQPPPSPLSADPASPSKRLRHKKINFLEMLKGEDSSSQVASPLIEGGVSDSSSPSPYEGVMAKGGSWKVANQKRRSLKEAGEGYERRSRKDRQKGTSVDETREPGIRVDGDSPDASAVTMKNKKRSPGSSAAVSLSTSSRSPKSRFGPIRVNVKSLVSASHSVTSPAAQTRKKNLFGRKAGSTNMTVDVCEDVSRAHSLRILKISHQDAEASGAASTQQILSPMAEVHLDLYKRSTSPCVKCSTCDKFLSVPAFLKHQHSSAVGAYGSQDLIDVQQQRKLVPVNKENVSAEERQLWREFVALQARLEHRDGAASPQAGPQALLSHAAATRPTSARDHWMSSELRQRQQAAGRVYNGLDTSASVSDSEVMAEIGATSMTSPDDGSCSNSDAMSIGSAVRPAEDCWEPQISVCSPPSRPLTLPPSTHTEREEKIVNNVKVDRKVIPLISTKAAPPKKQCQQRSRRIASPDNVRMSSRKRTKKQFYSFENYEFCGGGSKKRLRVEADAQDTVVDVTGTLLQDDITVVALSNGSSLELR